MNNVHQLPDARRVEDEAADWIACLHADEVSAEARARFEAWRNAHPSHGRTYESMCGVWRAFDASGPIVRAVSFGQSMSHATEPPPRRRRWMIGGAAAAAVLVAVLVFYSITRLPETRFETAIGEHASVVLPDGSGIELNSNSEVRVSYSDRARVIQLQRGEAFFKVAHDAVRPFWVVGGNSWVRALGTAFNVDLRPVGVRITVSEGAVQVGQSETRQAAAPNADELARRAYSVLSAGQQVDVQDGEASIRTVASKEMRHSLAWRSGKVYFEKQPLEAVIEEMSRYTALKLSISDDKLRELPVGGSFPATPQGAEMLISMLQDGFRLRIRREPGHVYIEDEGQ